MIALIASRTASLFSLLLLSCLLWPGQLCDGLARPALAAEAVWPIPALTAEQADKQPQQQPKKEQKNQTAGQEKKQAKASPPSKSAPAKSAGTKGSEAKAEGKGAGSPASPQPPQAEKAGGETKKTTKAQPKAAKAAATADVLSPRQEAAAAYARSDYAKAHDIWRELADKGDAEAMNGLGLLYERGQGVEPDAGRALHWFARAAEADDVAGMSNYGRMLEQGRGTMPDPAEAARWLDLAARRGSPEAQYNLALLYEHGRGVPQDDKAAAAWYSRAAAAGEGAALSRLGQFYRHGRGVPQDTARATLLLHAAAMQGQEDAIRELEELAQHGPQRPPAVLFGQRLDDTDRKAMRAALHKAGVPAKRSNDDFVCDVYDVHIAVPGATEMALCYAAGKAAPLGFVKLDYPAPDAETARRILLMAENRFGPPSAGEGDNARIWNLGSAVVATQHLPEHKLMSLMYMIPRVYHQTQRP